MCFDFLLNNPDVNCSVLSSKTAIISIFFPSPKFHNRHHLFRHSDICSIKNFSNLCKKTFFFAFWKSVQWTLFTSFFAWRRHSVFDKGVMYRRNIYNFVKRHSELVAIFLKKIEKKTRICNPDNSVPLHLRFHLRSDERKITILFVLRGYVAMFICKDLQT